MLVTLVVFLFLQSWRATLIPMLAVPVSVIGTFLGLLAFGMSINVLTLFGLVLAIGIVVDDAIVVIENVERIMATEKSAAAARGGPRHSSGGQRAGRDRARALLGVRAGRVHRRRHRRVLQAVRDDDRDRGRAVGNRGADADAGALRAAAQGHERDAHDRLLRLVQSRLRARRRAVMRARSTPCSAGRRRGSARSWCCIALAGLLWKRIPTAFIPTEDKGYMAMSIQLPDAASLQRTEAVVANVEKIIRSEPAVQNIVALVGLDLLSQSSATNGATVFLNLKPWERALEARRARLDRGAHQREAVRDEGRECVRLQPSRGARARRHGRRRGEPAEPKSARTFASSRGT